MANVHKRRNFITKIKIGDPWIINGNEVKENMINFSDQLEEADNERPL